jgi:hypothetical protein
MWYGSWWLVDPIRDFPLRIGHIVYTLTYTNAFCRFRVAAVHARRCLHVFLAPSTSQNPSSTILLVAYRSHRLLPTVIDPRLSSFEAQITMRTFASFSLLFACFSLVSSTASFAGLGGRRSSITSNLLFGVVPRGGGLFGGKDAVKCVIVARSDGCLACVCAFIAD